MGFKSASWPYMHVTGNLAITQTYFPQYLTYCIAGTRNREPVMQYIRYYGKWVWEIARLTYMQISRFFYVLFPWLFHILPAV